MRGGPCSTPRASTRTRSRRPMWPAPISSARSAFPSRRSVLDKMRASNPSFCAALLLLSIAGAGCSKSGSARPADSTNARTGAFLLTEDQRARIHLVTVHPTPFRPTLEATGSVAFNGDHSTQVLAPISGPAQQILVNPGTAVNKGDALATVASPDFAAAVAQYRKSESTYLNTKHIADLDEQLFKNDALARRDLEQ